MSTHNLTKIWFVVAGHNCEHTVPACLGSLLGQSSSLWHCIVIDDGSDDRTLASIKRLTAQSPNHFTVLNNTSRLYKAVSFQSALKLVPDEGIVAELDLDDCLSDMDTVRDLLIAHQTWDLIWTQHRTINHTTRYWDTWESTTLPIGFSRIYPPRAAVWNPSFFPGHMRTAKRYLLDHIDPAHLLFRGGSLKVAFDLVYYTALLELTPASLVCFYDKCVYDYHVWPQNDDFRERDIRLMNQENSNSEFCQTEIDAWLGFTSPQSALLIDSQIEHSGHKVSVNRLVRSRELLHGTSLHEYRFELETSDLATLVYLRCRPMTIVKTETL